MCLVIQTEKFCVFTQQVRGISAGAGKLMCEYVCVIKGCNQKLWQPDVHNDSITSGANTSKLTQTIPL